MEVLIVSLLNGLVYGMLLFMLASGLTLIFSMMGVLTFAHASMYMLGAYFAYSISRITGFWPDLVLAPVLCGRLGAIIEMYALRRVHKNGTSRNCSSPSGWPSSSRRACRWRGACCRGRTGGPRRWSTRCSGSTASTSQP